MVPFRKILFPVDYSDSCMAIVPYVTEMLNQFSAELTLVHAYGPDFLAYSEMSAAYANLEESSRGFEEQRLLAFALEMFPNRQAETIARLGEGGALIHHVVQHEGADLVMLPTHGRGPVRRFLLGSVATKVLHDVSTPVWTVTSTGMGRKPSNGKYRSYLCALDETEDAAEILQAAEKLASAFYADLRILHVLETPPLAFDVDFSSYNKMMRDAAEVWIRGLKARTGIDVRHLVIDGPVAHAVREEAIRTKADLIVTGRGRSQDRFAGLLSRLYEVIREAPCPVLSI